MKITVLRSFQMHLSFHLLLKPVSGNFLIHDKVHFSTFIAVCKLRVLEDLTYALIESLTLIDQRHGPGRAVGAGQQLGGRGGGRAGVMIDS